MFMFGNKKQTKKDRGFTLIEALVAIFILSLALAAFVSSTVTSIRSFENAENFHLASEIAKEGIELVINKKENHITCVNTVDCVDISNWQENLTEGSFEISSSRPKELLPDGQLNEYIDLYQDRHLCFIDMDIGESSVSNIGKFGYCTGPLESRDGVGTVIPGNFIREIRLKNLNPDTFPDSPDGFQVKSIVKWKGGHEVVLETYLYGR